MVLSMLLLLLLFRSLLLSLLHQFSLNLFVQRVPLDLKLLLFVDLKEEFTSMIRVLHRVV